MKNTLPLAALAALALGACSSEPDTINGPVDPQADALNAAAPIENMRMIQASRTFRCKDNSLIYVDFYTDNSAGVRFERGTPPTILTAAEGKPPYLAEGWSISENADQVTILAPGKGSQSCTA